MKTQREIIAAFKAENQNLSFKPQNGEYPTDTRLAFIDFVDYLAKSGLISEALAKRATLTPPKPKPKPKPRPTHITGRRWFDSRYGNTYNSVTIHLSDLSTVYLPMAYGYDDHYLYRAIDYIQKHWKFKNPGNIAGTRYLREVVKVNYSVIDVKRKKEL